MAPNALERTRSQDVTLDDVLNVYHMAKIGIHKSPWRVAPRLVSSYRRIKLLLEATGKLPS
jgi:hypothetical protein